MATTTAGPDQRKAKRFDLRLPIELIRTGARRTSSLEQTCNLSSCGVLFTSGSEIQVGEPIEFLITLPNAMPEGPNVRLHCKGKVQRLDPGRPQAEAVGRPYAIAATLERYEFVRQ